MDVIGILPPSIPELSKILINDLHFRPRSNAATNEKRGEEQDDRSQSDQINWDALVIAMQVQ